MTAPTPVAAVRRRTRFAVILGAAVAIAATTLLGTDVPASFAEDGFFGMLFSDAPHRRVVEPLSYSRGIYYGRYAPRRRAAHYKRHRHFAQRHASHFARRAGVAARYAAEDSRHGASAYLRRRLVHRPEASAAAIIAATAPAGASGRRIFCVRSCDAAYFAAPAGLAAAGPKAQQKACRQACPGASTQVFALSAGATRMKDAVAATDGRLYADLVAQIGGAAQNAPGCSCGSAADADISRPARAFAAATPAQTAITANGSGAGSSAYFDDPTLRPGDTVVTPQGVRVVRAGSHYPFKRTDFLSLAETREVSTEKRGALAAIERVLKTPHGRALAGAGARRD